MDQVTNRAEGCLLGQLAGDALGAQVEFKSPAEIRRRYPAGVRTMKDGGTWNTLAGQPTDDSELALALARSLVREGRYHRPKVARAYREWLASGPFDVGGTTNASLSFRTASASVKGSQANGSLMRVSPIAIAASATSDAAALARSDSGITHPNEVCRDSCAAFAAAAHVLIHRGSLSMAASAALAEAKAPTVYAAITKGLDGERPASAAGWVLNALQNAFYQLAHAKSLEEGLVDTVGMGGDSDTNGCIAGALLGAAYGRRAIPKQWERSVLGCVPTRENGAAHPRPEEYWPVDALELARDLLAVQAEV